MPFQVLNTSRNDAVIAAQVELAATFFSRFLGLMGRAALPEGHGLLIEGCRSIHMFFMRFPIDVAFLDSHGKVVRALHGIKPWRATRVYLDAQDALELPAGTLAKTGVQEGDVLRLESSV